MGTHKLPLRLGDAPILEVLAVDPVAPASARPRSFEQDERGSESPPQRACWVARTDHIHPSAADAGEALGAIKPLSWGDFQWLIATPHDDSLPLGGWRRPWSIGGHCGIPPPV